MKSESEAGRMLQEGPALIAMFGRRPVGQDSLRDVGVRLRLSRKEAEVEGGFWWAMQGSNLPTGRQACDLLGVKHLSLSAVQQNQDP